MKRFHFTLEALLDQRCRKEDACKQELAKVNSRLLESQGGLRAIEQEWVDLQTSEVERRKMGATPESMGQAVAYRLHLEHKAILQELEIRRIVAEQEQKRQMLVKATQEKKALENLRERRYEEWRKAANRAEAKAVDDLCQIQYVRNLRAAE